MEQPSPERWLPVVGREIAYEVSDLGRVRSRDRVVLYRTGSSRHLRSKMMRLSVDGNGYRYVDLYWLAQRLRKYVHTAVLEAFVGPAPEGTECCHGDGDPANNELGNLRWGTKSENRFDSVRHGTHYESQKSTCPRGHLLSPPNLAASFARRGHRRCLACERATSNRKNALRFNRVPGDLAVLADGYYLEIMSSVVSVG